MTALLVMGALVVGYLVGRHRGMEAQELIDADRIIEANESAAASIRLSTERMNEAADHLAAAHRYRQRTMRDAAHVLDHSPIPLRVGRVILVDGANPFHVVSGTIARRPDGIAHLNVHCIDPVGWNDRRLLEELDQ